MEDIDLAGQQASLGWKMALSCPRCRGEFIYWDVLRANYAKNSEVTRKTSAISYY